MFQSTEEGVIVSLRIVANAAKTEIVGEYQNCLKIKIKSPPVDGKANSEIISYLSKHLGLAKNQLEILKGEKSNQKKIQIRGIELEELRSKLLGK